MKPTETRGYRNNNPGNIRKSGDPWQGLDTPSDDGAFFRFKEMYWGVRAMARIIINYQDKHSLNSITEIVTRWAPASDNNHTDAYIAAVERDSGLPRHKILDTHAYVHLKPLIAAMIKVECAGLVLPDAVMDRGLALAGVESPTKPSRTIKAAVATAATAAATYAPVALEAVGSQSSVLRSLMPYWPYAGVLATIATVCGCIYIVWRKLEDRAALRPGG